MCIYLCYIYTYPIITCPTALSLPPPPGGGGAGLGASGDLGIVYI